MTIGKRIKEARRSKGLSQEELALKLNNIYGTKIVKSMISKWENDKVEPRMEYVRHMSDFFSLSLNYLIGLSDEKEGNKINKLINLAQTLSEEDLEAIINITEKFAKK